MKIVIIDPNPAEAENMRLCLSLSWAQEKILVFTNPVTAIDLIKTESPAIIILSMDLNGQDGFDILKSIRANFDTPLIAVSSQKNEQYKIRALELGADDYVTRPIVMIDFLTRIKAVLRRSNVADAFESTFTRGNITIRFSTHEVYVGGKPVKLSPTEYSLLYTLVRNEGEFLSPQFLLETVLGSEDNRNIRDLRVCIHRLRTKLKDNVNYHPILNNRRGVGYRFVIS
jgi:DNA-binding response OmpR family regulator